MSDVGVRELVVVHAGFGAAAVPYEEGWELQRRTHALRVDDAIPDTVLLMEHQPVYTAGKRTALADRPLGDPGAPVVDVDRGGKITWHGPGQLTGYPIVRLTDPRDVVGYVRLLEQMMMDVCADLGLATVRVEGRSGIWVPGAPDRKIGSIGIRVAQGVAMHGFMLNCDNDLGWFDKIVPCGIRDVGSTTLSRELDRNVTVAEVVPLVERHLAAVLGADGTLHRTTAQLEALRGAQPAVAITL
ncbi:lipoyl(octanoyl) transferase [Actinomadura pelletieri DSM 43383]|uniref:Octanoyltransferase n=1 Tax=Actinomadura pelletieri DSM 43383 TaxID=1120940 RepID=A0A495QP16_9ACTN|nr:lipoyl(octanoyl) transferase LipB [Actinomadura pelletieri]RKS74687.1 lipoyl(octanoyl) transferase [Actinomadura pelletieri DSM 43383]